MSYDRLAAALSDRYRLERELGQGGMATVYLAADLKHDRKVAIKVLKPDLAAVLGAERFIAEIKTTAALSHPHILPLFDSGEAGGFLYYVMPYLDGETIREKLTQEGQFSIGEAVKIATEVAEALDYAHQHGVIHRDIKPENILLHAGRPMVMDFGIALAVSAAAGGRMTETGLSLGTPHYMSPEQATADREITGRSDIYSLASVLYEMLAGVPPHDGGSAQQVIMRIIAETPKPVGELRRSVPANVAAALGKALEKLPADRFDSARAFAEALANPHFTTATAVVSGGVAMPRQWIRNRYSQLALGIIAALGATVGWLTTRGDGGEDEPEAVIAFTLIDSLPPGFGFDVADNGAIAYTRGGKLYVQPPGDSAASEVPGIERVGFDPVFSPDGAHLAVGVLSGSANEQHASIVRVPVGGGVATRLLTTPTGAVAPLEWSDDGWIYALSVPTPTPDSIALVRVRDVGGEPQPIVRAAVLGLTLLPGERTIVVCTMDLLGNVQVSSVYAVDIASGDTTHVTDDACSPRWAPTGHLLLTSRDGTLRAVPFDPAAVRVTGAPIPLISDIKVGNGGEASYHLTRGGTLLYVRGRPIQSRAFEYLLAGRDGSRTVLPISPGRLRDATFAPGGRRIAYIRDDRPFTFDLDVGTNRLIGGSAGSGRVVLSPDGRSLAYAGPGNAPTVRALEGDTTEHRLGPAGGGFLLLEQWLADGTMLGHRLSLSNIDIVAFHADTTGMSRTVLGADWSESYPQVSHDGRWIAYVSNESGRNQLTVRSWPALERKTVIADSITGGTLRWSPDNRTIHYMQGQRVMAVEIAGSDSLRATARRVIADSMSFLDDLSPDGRHLVLRRLLAATALPPSSLVGITRWLGDVRRKTAARGQ